MISEEGNQFVVQYKDQCEVLIKEYNNYQEKLEIKITEEEKLFEYLQAIKENGNKIIPSTSSLLFSDGTQMCKYWTNKKDKIYKMITEEGNQFVAQYKEQCKVLIKEYNNYKEKQEKKITEEEKLLEYLQAMKENDNKIIPYNSPLLFSHGEKMNQYWSNNKDKIYKMITEKSNPFIVQYKEQCEVLIDEYNKKQLRDEEKLLEYLQAMKANGNKIIPKSSSLLFSNGTQMGYYWNNKKDKIYKMITEEGNQFVVQYKEQCEELIKEYNKKTLSDEEKLLEYLQAMKENGNGIISGRSSLLFSDGTQMCQHWNRSKNKIYKMISEEGNLFVVQYKDQCEVLIKEYNKKTLSNEEKLLEYLQAMKENGNKIIPQSSSLLFSDGTKMGTYWNDKKDKIYIMITEEENQFVAQYKDQCEVLIKEYNKKQLSEEEKLFEYLQAMKDNENKIIPYNSSLLFSDGIQMAQYWRNNKDKIYKMITEEGNQFVIQYKDQCEVLIKEYNKKTLSNEEKLLEYLQAMKENGNKIIPQSSSLLFSDGTKMGTYWNDKKDKIYIMITEEENQFIVQYKDQCEVLINKYIEFQERKKKKQEKYKESESDFREKSSFDKVLADEIRKGPNEDGKLL